MHTKQILSLSLAAVLLLFFNCPAFSAAASDKGAMEEENTASLEDVKDKIGAAAQSISQYTAAQRDQAVEKAQAELNELDSNIETLEQKVNRHWDRLSSETKQRWQDTRQQLSKKRVEAAEWFGGVKRGSTEAWEEIKKGYGKAYTELEMGWERARKEFSDKADDDPDTMKK